MNNFDIKQYLVEPAFNQWLNSQGFDAECASLGIATFQQAFDFVEGKFGIKIVPTTHSPSVHTFKVKKWDGEFFWETIINNEMPVKHKREANIAACNAIKEYISKQNVKTP